MTFNPHFAGLQQYPFERLRALIEGVTPPAHLAHISLSLGEPKHAPPPFVIDALSDPHALRQHLATYPATRGSDELRMAIAAWLGKRFDVQASPDTQILPVNGTREALFSFAQAMLSGAGTSKVLMPNPFYQIYEGAALLAGATPYFINNERALGYQQDYGRVAAEVWRDTELVYLCSPGNPTGHIMTIAQQQELIELAHQYDFIIAADECYSELYFDDEAAPCSLLQASDLASNADFDRCVVFHSLSKRSNLPGLRSGFVAGSAKLLAEYFQYRTYHGCALSAHHQQASALAWGDEQHVVENRALYRAKFDAVSAILAPHYALTQPDGGFYHWLPTPIDDGEFARRLLDQQNITVMPGSFLARDTAAGNPGTNHVRLAWVATFDECVEAAQRLAAFAQHLA
jgi:N-succinyldiaminopimelate aminotransferase